MARLRSDFFVSAHLRRCAVAGIDAVLRRRGAPEAGAIFLKVDRLDGSADLYGPAPQSVLGDGPGERLFIALMRGAAPAEIEARLAREGRFDPDYWLMEIDDREGRHFLDLAE